MASNVTQNRNNQKLCHLNLIKRLDLTTSIKTIQGTEDYVITTETVSKTQTGYQRNDLVSSTHPKKKFAREKKKKEGNEEKESLGLNTSALFHEDLSTS